MDTNHYNRIEKYKEKLKDIYTVDIQYNQAQNGCYAHYNKIIIKLTKDYSEYDFEHELAHLEFLTQEIKIEYLYPKEEFFEDKELFTFSNNLLNIIYDIYVDAYLSVNLSIPDLYYRKKIEIFTTYLNYIYKHLDISEGLIEIIKNSIQEYIEVLNMIIEERIDGTIYITKNKITDQRGHINQYLHQAGISNKFEWITYNTLYLREQNKALAR